ncbi:MAG: glycosyltransferase family 2 protein [Clostridiales bacterium]|nr:glycosyltransferase family 2 protein [Clostridiales bacterium]
MDRTENKNKEERAPERPLVSIIVPAFNEEKIIEKNLTELCEYMKTLEANYRWELIIINDGSTDATGDLAESFVRGMDNAFVLHHAYNFRLGQALRYAFHNSCGDYIVVLDIDLSYAPDHIGKMLEKLRETRAKIVICSPYAKGGKVSNVPCHRKFLSRWANRFLCLVATRDLYSDRLTNITGMVRAYDGEFLRRLNLWAMDMDINPEIIYKAKILRARIVEIPAHLNWRLEKAGEGGGKKRKSSIRILRSIIQSLLSGFILRPFAFFMLPGFIIFLLSLYPLGWAFIHTVNKFNTVTPANLSFDHRLSGAIAEAFHLSPHSFIVGGVALLVAFQLISLGILAYQQKRYFEELFYLGSIIYKDPRLYDLKKFPFV